MTTFEGNTLFTDLGTVEFERIIRDILEHPKAIIVRTRCASTAEDVNNIYGVIDNKIAWRIQDIIDYNENYAPFKQQSYSGVRIYTEDPELIMATSFEGFRMLINPNNGRIVGTAGMTK